MRMTNLFNLEWLSRHRRLVLWIISTSLVPSVILLVLSYYQTITQARAKLEAASEQGSRQVLSLIRSAEITLEELEVYLENAEPDSTNTWKLLQRIAYNDPRYREIGVVNEEGFLSLSSLGPVDPPIPIDSQSRADLSVKKLQIIGPLTTNIMQERSIVLVLPTKGKGELNILIDPILLNTLWRGFDELDIGPDGYVAYLNQGNQKVIASTGLLPREENLLMMASSRQQISSVKSIDGTDILIVVATSREWVLRNWRNLALMIVPVSFLSNILIAFLFIRLMYSAQLLKYDIRIGLQKFEFELHYQPIFDLQTGHCVGSEALVRWQHGSRGLLLPGLFIPIAEQTGSIVELGEWVLERTLLDQKKILKKHPSLYISVNLSPAQLGSKLSSQNIIWFLRQHQEVAKQLIFEITETTLIEDYQENIIKAIADLRALGAKVALDDFGTGHCGINYLSRLNFDYLKIDQRFTSASDSDSTLTSVLDGIIDLGKRLKVDFIAEGIETESQKWALLRKKIRYGQGRLLAHPMDIREFEQFLSTQQNPDQNVSGKPDPEGD